MLIDTCGFAEASRCGWASSVSSLKGLAHGMPQGYGIHAQHDAFCLKALAWEVDAVIAGTSGTQRLLVGMPECEFYPPT